MGRSAGITHADSAGKAPNRLTTAAQELLTRSLPGEEPAPRRLLDDLANASPAALAPLDPTSRRQAAAGMILARARNGRPRAAIELAAVEVRQQAANDADVPSAVISAFWSACAEAYVTNGWPRLANLYSQRAQEYALDTADSTALYRAFALEAVSRALNGEYDLAEQASRSAHALESTHDWLNAPAAYPLVLGDILIASARFDAARLTECTSRLRRMLPPEPLWLATATVAEAMTLLIQNQTGEAIGLVMSVTNGADSPGILSMIRGFALGVQADLLLAQGDARRTLGLLDDARSPAGHALCFDMQRSAAYLLLGQNREALRTTDACLRIGRDHCLRTIPPILFRRAIANDRLGQPEKADDAFEEAFHLIAASGSSTPLLTLPREDVARLLDRLEKRRPELAAEIVDVRGRLSAVPSPRARHRIPDLTARENAIALQLRSGETIASLAKHLQVSPNTLKTQLRGLYKKLGVSTRADAVHMLEEARFFA